MNLEQLVRGDEALRQSLDFGTRDTAQAARPLQCLVLGTWIERQNLYAPIDWERRESYLHDLWDLLSSGDLDTWIWP